MTVCSGGHPSPLLVRADGDVEVVGSSGSLLGVLRDPRLRDHETELRPDDTLVLYTDGLTDAFAPSRLISEEELTVILGECARRDARATVERLASLLDIEPGEPRDDVAVLVLRRVETLRREQTPRAAIAGTASA